MVSHPSYFEAVLSHRSRERLMLECPALQLLCYQHVVAALLTKARLIDPLARSGAPPDAVSGLLAVRSVEELLARVFTDVKAEDEQSRGFWPAMRRTLEAAWTPTLPGECTAASRAAVELLASVAGQPQFLFPTADPGAVLPDGSLRNALDCSKRFLRSVTTCALSGSAEPLRSSQQNALSSIIQFSRLVPPPQAAGEVTSEGLNFCMMSLQQQWWVLVCGAMDRVVALTQQQQPDGPVPVPLMWQLLAVLAVLDTSACMYAFPSKAAAPTAYHVVGRLSEVGLTFLVRTADGQQCFAVSPHFLHALEWQATTPVCALSMLEVADAAALASTGSCRREDTDTIITETNFRLYAYTRNEDLLRILDQFAVREERVDDILVCYRLTRGSFVSALRKGITAAQILKFLSLRAHPSMLRRYGEDAHGAVGGGGASMTGTGAGGVLSPTSSLSTSALAIPQSVCDQLFMWESECKRVVFTKDVVMLRNMTAVQQSALTAFLQGISQADAVVYRERGVTVVREEVYDRFLAAHLEEACV